MSLLYRLFSGLCLLLALGLLGSGLVVLSDGWHKYAYLLDIFTVPIASAAVVTLIMLTLLRQGAAALIVGVALLCFGLSLAPDRRADSPPATGTPVRLVFANLLIRNQTPDALIPWIDAQSPDIITLVEANHRAHDHLVPAFSKSHPHIARRYDIYILSRYPLSRINGREPGFALLTARVATPEGPLTVAVAHLTRPWPFTSPADQPRQLRRIGLALKREGGPVVLVGDFNTAAHTGPMRHFKSQHQLASPPGYTGTWPALIPGVFRIGIDHIMVGPELSISNRITGPLYGSDHSPVRADVRRRTSQR